MVAEKTGKNFRGLLFLPHPVDHHHIIATALHPPADWRRLAGRPRMNTNY